jgi:hypothetical protein
MLPVLPHAGTFKIFTNCGFMTMGRYVYEKNICAFAWLMGKNDPQIAKHTIYFINLAFIELLLSGKDAS